SKRGCPAISRISSAPVCPRAPTMPIEIGGSIMLSLQFCLQVPLHRRPLALDNGVRHGVANAAVGMAQMVADDAVALGAQPLDRSARAVVEPTGLEPDRYAAHGLERMREQQSLGLGIEAGALHPAR